MTDKQEEIGHLYERRIAWQEESARLHARIDEITGLLQDMRSTLDLHVALDKDLSPTLKEIVVVWRGSKIMIPLLLALATGFVALFDWAKAHLKI